MEVVHTHCAGLDVHKKTVVASRLIACSNGSLDQQTRTFSTMTADLLALSDWLMEGNVTHVAMESTGEYWKPVYYLLENNFELLLVNARHIKNVPGRKSDVKDAQWIAQLLRHGLLKASFVPPALQRDLRELCRYRATFVRERAALVNRVQKLLESANIKLASVASDVMGVSGRAILTALCEGQSDPKVLSELARGRLKDKQELLERSLEGRVNDQHRFILKQLLEQIDNFEECIARFDQQIEEDFRPFEQAVAHIDTIPGISRCSAEQILAEIGWDMTRFPSPGHLASWAGLCPGNRQSAGKVLSSRTGSGNKSLRQTLVQAAQAASRTKTYLGAQYHRLAARRGKKRAILAVAHSILLIIYHLLERGQDYQDLGADYFDRRDPQKTARRLMRRLTQLGYSVSLTSSEPEPAPA